MAAARKGESASFRSPPDSCRGRENLTGADVEGLRYARKLLEQRSLASRLAGLLGVPVEVGFRALPARWSRRVHDAAALAMRQALDLAVRSLPRHTGASSADTSHRVVVATTGAIGGCLGLGALSVELPVSTAVMLRSIADIARSEGEDLDDVGARLACLEVFALGGRKADDADSGYYALRATLAGAVSEATTYIAEKGIAREGAPAIVRLIGEITSRFGVVVSEKAAAQAVPVLGAAGGALINSLFMSHFQNIARGHFVIRRLERRYGREVVARSYAAL